jgi:hypothetical protein
MLNSLTRSASTMYPIKERTRIEKSESMEIQVTINRNASLMTKNSLKRKIRTINISFHNKDKIKLTCISKREAYIFSPLGI